MKEDSVYEICDELDGCTTGPTVPWPRKTEAKGKDDTASTSDNRVRVTRSRTHSKKFCSNCGARIGKYDSYCSACGEKIE